MGSRHNYAVPAMLERYRLLERFYTEICGNVGIGRGVSYLAKFPYLSPKAARLANRIVPAPVRRKTVCFWAPVMKHALRTIGSRIDLDEQYRESLRFAEELGAAMIRAGYGRATHVYSMLGEGGPFLVEARRRGIQVICEVYIALSADRIVAEESRQYPDFCQILPDYEAIRQELANRTSLVDLADWLVCPSETVKNDLTTRWGVHPARTAVVPYGVDPKWFDLEPKPVPKRVLFVGTANLRKGIHYLAMAANELAQRRKVYEFHIVGDVSDEVRCHRLCERLTILGRLPHNRIEREFQKADVFVLPSLAEGSAQTTYEALAASIPVITTPAAGSVVRDGEEGLIVSERNTSALSEAIERIVEDRRLRNEMSARARRRAADYTWSHFGARLFGAITRFGHS